MERNLLDRRQAWLLCALVALAALLINPIGYVGGHFDDARYLEAAACWREAKAVCLPANHWAARWPVVAPIAVLSKLFGETRATVGLGALPGWIGSIVLLGWLGRLWIDRRAGLIAAILLGATPIFTMAALQPGVDTIELAFQLAALVAATIAFRRQSRPLALLAGALAALAVQSRDTSLLFCMAGALAWFTLAREPRRVLLWAIVGFATIMSLELAAFALTTGNPFYRYSLSLAHVGVPTQELPAGFDTRQSPLLNAAYIASWRREMGIKIWWPVDPWLNLTASPRIGYLLLSAVLLLLLGWRDAAPRVRHLLGSALAAALLIAVVLVYGLAIDPKPRMFLLLAAAAALASGAMVSAAWAERRPLVPMVAVGLVVVLGLVTLSRVPHVREFEAIAARWVRNHPGDLAVDRDTVPTLRLTEGLDTLPLTPSDRRYRLAGGEQPCDRYGLTVVDQSPVHGGGRICLLDTRPSRR